jgi:outer membrane protein assembly factor BamA
MRHCVTGWAWGVVLVVIAWPTSGMAQERGSPPWCDQRQNEPCICQYRNMEEPPCEGLQVARVEITGCDDAWCETKVNLRKLHSLVELKPGQSWTAKSSFRACELLEATRFFKSVSINCDVSADGSKALPWFVVTPNHWVRRVKISGNRALFESDIKKRLTLRSGTALNPGTRTFKAKIKEQIRELKELYQKEGFDNAQIEISTHAVGTERVDVTIVIDEAKKAKITGIDVELPTRDVSSAGMAYGKKIQCMPLKKHVLAQKSGFSVGDIFTKRRRKKAQRRLKDYLRARGVVKPSVTIVYNAKREKVKIRIASKGCYAIRFYERDDPKPGPVGFQPADPEPILKFLRFKQTGRFSLRGAEESRADLQDWYHARGYLFANVGLEYRQLPMKQRTQGGVHGVITFLSTLNYVTEIRAVTIRGNKALKTDVLYGVVGTRPYDFFGDGGYLRIERMFGDLLAIQRLYFRKGFIGMRYKNAPAGKSRVRRIRLKRTYSGGDELLDYTFDRLHFRIRKHPNESVIYIEIDIDEGRPTNVTAIMLRGVPEKQRAILRTKLGLQPGSPFSPHLVKTDLRLLRRHFQERGYHEVKVSAKCATASVRLSSNCDWKSLGVKSVQVQFKISPGPKYLVGETFVRGNFRSNEGFLLKRMPKKGQVYSQYSVARAERRIRELGAFSSVRVLPIGLESNLRRRRVALVCMLEERPAQFIELATGIETLHRDDGGESGDDAPWLSSGLSAFIGAVDSAVYGNESATPFELPDVMLTLEVAYRNRNFRGRAEELRVPAKYGLSLGALALIEDKDSAEGISALHRYASLQPTWYIPKIFGQYDLLQFSLFGRYDRATSKVIDEVEAGIKAKYSSQISKRFSWNFSTTASNIHDGDFLLEPINTVEWDPKLEVDVGFALNFLDNPINPTKGFWLGSQVSYIYKQEDGQFNNYLKWEISAKAYLNFRKRFILALFFRYGDSHSFDDGVRDLPTVERYRLGGIQGMRGFENDGIRPFGQDGNPILENGKPFHGGNLVLNGSVELRFPILRRVGLWATGFLDYGALARDRAEDLGSDSFRFSVGVGVRWLIGNQVPIRIDYGINLDRRCTVERTAQGCPEGDLEPNGQAHFAILYPF